FAVIPGVLDANPGERLRGAPHAILVCSAVITSRITRRRRTTDHSNNPDFAARRVSDGYGTPSVRPVTAMSGVIVLRSNVN
ncbi:MAG: hypothetical protein AAF802_32695, partial [Planctomycetota bacterium]